MQETEKIWMNGELVDWADAKVHVGAHGLHYGSGVFEGIRCYDTAKGPAVFRLSTTSSASSGRRGPPHGRRTPHGAPRGDPRAARLERPRVVLRAADRVLRLQRAGRRDGREPRRGRDHQLPVGRVPRRGGIRSGISRKDLELGAGRAERDPARRQGGHLPELDARDDRGAPGRVRRGDHALARRLRRRRPRREHLRRHGRAPANAASSRRRSSQGSRGTRSCRSPTGSATGSRSRCSSTRSLPRGRGLHGRDRRGGHAGAGGRRPGDRRRAGDARAAEGLPRHRLRP